MSAAPCPTVPMSVRGTVGQTLSNRTTRGTTRGTADIKALALKVLSLKKVGQAVGQEVGQAKNEWDKPGTNLSHELSAYRQLQGLMREHAGCRIHVYATKPEPQFTLRQPPEWYADGFAEVVFDLFLKAAGIIGQELRTAGAIRF